MPIPKKHKNLGTCWIEVPVLRKWKLCKGLIGIGFDAGTTTEHITVFVDPQKLAAHFAAKVVRSRRGGLVKFLGGAVILRHERGG